jgi:hypothetical protein
MSVNVSEVIRRFRAVSIEVSEVQARELIKRVSSLDGAMEYYLNNRALFVDVNIAVDVSVSEVIRRFRAASIEVSEVQARELIKRVSSLDGAMEYYLNNRALFDATHARARQINTLPDRGIIGCADRNLCAAAMHTDRYTHQLVDVGIPMDKISILRCRFPRENEAINYYYDMGGDLTRRTLQTLQVGGSGSGIWTGLPSDTGPSRDLSRQMSDELDGANGTKSGIIEQLVLQLLMGEFYPVERNGFIKDQKYRDIWTKHPYHVLPIEVLMNLLPQLDEIIKCREQDIVRNNGRGQRDAKDKHQYIVDGFTIAKRIVENLIAIQEEYKLTDPGSFAKENAVKAVNHIYKLESCKKAMEKYVEDLRKENRAASKSLLDRIRQIGERIDSAKATARISNRTCNNCEKAPAAQHSTANHSFTVTSVAVANASFVQPFLWSPTPPAVPPRAYIQSHNVPSVVTSYPNTRHCLQSPAPVSSFVRSGTRAQSSWDNYRSNVFEGGTRSQMSAGYKAWKASPAGASL